MSRTFVPRILREYGVEGYFETLVLSSVFGVRKPDPAILAPLLRRYRREEMVMVGDRLSTDIRMAVDAGITSVLVLSGETDRALLEASGIEPTFVRESVAEIVPEEIVRTLSASDLNAS